MTEHASLSPIAPPLVSQAHAAVGGRLGDLPEHFRVNEVPLYEPSGEGEHWYVRVQKRDMTTVDMVRIVARAANVRDSEVGYAGLKDKQAVTQQWLSVPGHAPAPASWSLPENVEVVLSSRHKNKLRTGHLAGNEFEITLADVPEGGVERAQAIIASLAESGLPNYFGEQRFGWQGKNLENALAWLRGTYRSSRKSARLHNKLFPSVLQAEVFNRYLARRAPLGLDRLVAGEVVRLDGSASVFVVKDPEHELERLQRRDIVLTGPIFGPKAVAAENEAGELERESLAELGLAVEDLERLGRRARGTRRDLVVNMKRTSVQASDPGSLTLAFYLPRGSYATQVIRELSRTPWCEVRRAAAAAAS